MTLPQKTLMLSAFLIFPTACSDASSHSYASLVEGHWNCSLKIETNTGYAENYWAISYRPEGKYESKGRAEVSFPTGIGSILMENSSEGTFEVVGNTIHSQAVKFSENYSALSGRVLESDDLLKQVEATLRPVNESRFDEPIVQEIVDIDGTRMYLVEQGQSSEPANCTRMDGGI